MTEYISVSEDQCWQTKNGSVGTPCFNDAKKIGVRCAGKCPIELAMEKKRESAFKMLHKGICFMDERHPGYIKAIATAKADGQCEIGPDL